VESRIKALRYTKRVLGHASDMLEHAKDTQSTCGDIGRLVLGRVGQWLCSLGLRSWHEGRSKDVGIH